MLGNMDPNLVGGDMEDATAAFVQETSKKSETGAAASVHGAQMVHATKGEAGVKESKVHYCSPCNRSLKDQTSYGRHITTKRHKDIIDAEARGGQFVAKTFGLNIDIKSDKPEDFKGIPKVVMDRYTEGGLVVHGSEVVDFVEEAGSQAGMVIANPPAEAMVTGAEAQEANAGSQAGMVIANPPVEPMVTAAEAQQPKAAPQ